MKTRLPIGFASFLVIGSLASAHCGGSTAGNGGTEQPLGTCSAPKAPPSAHRATAIACAPSTSGVEDSGISDGCLVDGDCATGNACGCASQFGGNARHTNGCVTSNCRVDSDCGAGGYCSPSTGSRCGSLSGYFCHTTADCCANDSDCPAENSCLYDPTVAHWQCTPVTPCNG